MESPELKKYVKEARKFGLSEEQITRELSNAGWCENYINFVLRGELSAKFEFNDVAQLQEEKSPTARITPLVVVSAVRFFVVGVIFAVVHGNLSLLNTADVSKTSDFNQKWLV